MRKFLRVAGSSFALLLAYAAILFLGFVFLSGCTSTKYVPCPSLVSYSKQDQKALGVELQAHPQPQTIRVIGDYIGLRDQVRACQK